jgi:hypothetical protein
MCVWCLGVTIVLGLSDEQLAILLQDDLFLQELKAHPDFQQVMFQIKQWDHLDAQCSTSDYKNASLSTGKVSSFYFFDLMPWLLSYPQ